VEFEWDEAKSEANLLRRGFGFDFAARIFESPVIEHIDTRQDYSEQRIIALGCVDNEWLVVVYTWRGERRRIISARKASRKEIPA